MPVSSFSFIMIKSTLDQHEFECMGSLIDGFFSPINAHYSTTWSIWLNLHMWNLREGEPIVMLSRTVHCSPCPKSQLCSTAHCIVVDEVKMPWLHVFNILLLTSNRLNMFILVVVQLPSRVWLCDPWTAEHQIPCPSSSPRFAQTQVHWVGDAIQHLILWSPSPPAFNLSQHQGLFKWVSSLHQVA